VRSLATKDQSLDRLRKAGSVLVCRSAKEHSEPVSKPHNKRGAKVDEITRTPLELIERIAALVPAGAAQAPGALPTGGEGVEGSDVEPNWDEAAQLVPDFEVDQRISW